MTTSLPDDSALYHAQTKVFQRSAGRSAVAAAAYRSASKLHDERTGQNFDYTKKHAVTAFIVAPMNAPTWCLDREQLWNRAELAEVKSNAVVGREWEISIPRDIPQHEWEAFARQVVAPWIEAGAIADIAIHCPSDVYGNPQPHLHIMLSTRHLDATTETGFAKRKNDNLTRLFESGGRHGGGKIADALKLERERISSIMNGFLEAAGSPRRTSHLSNVARYPDTSRDPEPTMGEGRLHARRKRRQSDSKTRLVSAMRASRAIEFELSKTEEEIMSANPKFQSSDGIRPRHQQDYKTKLFAERFPDVTSADIGEKLHMVDTRKPNATRIQTRDGGWLELQGRQLKTFGRKGFADELARQLYDADYADDIERLEESAVVARKGSRQEKTHTNTRPLHIETVADGWRSRGYTDVTEGLDGVYIKIGSCRVQDLGEELRIHGKYSDIACRAVVEKAVAEWGSEFEVFGSREFKDSVWLEAQRQGATLIDSTTGKSYEPSAEVRKRWEADSAQMQKQAGEIEGIRAQKKLATMLRDAASGDKEALRSLKQRDPHLATFLVEHLDEAQLRQLVHERDEDLEPQLDGMREIGREYAVDIGGEASVSADMRAAIDEAMSIPDDEDNDPDALDADRDSVERSGRESSASPRLP